MSVMSLAAPLPAAAEPTDIGTRLELEPLAFGHRRAGWSTAIWRVERRTFDLLLRIPATGDCSYPGLIEAPDGSVCMSYYSQHAYDHGVFDPPVEAGIGSVADVYFAELDLT